MALGVDRTIIGSEGVSQIAKRIRCLKLLSVNDCSLSDEGMPWSKKGIINVSKNIPKITVLKCCNKQIKEASNQLTNIASDMLMINNRQLEMLQIRSNSINEENNHLNGVGIKKLMKIGSLITLRIGMDECYNRWQ